MENQQLQKEVSSSNKPPMWTKAQEKKTARKRHVRNFTSGHVKVEEYHLHRTGIRGRKRWIVWTGIIVLMLIALTNLVLNCFLIAVLQLGPTGLPYLVFMQNNTVIFPKQVTVSKTEVSSKISSFYNLSLDIGANTSNKVSLHSGPFRTSESITTILNPSQIFLDSSGIVLKPFESFKFYNSSSKEEIMSVNKSMTRFANLSSVKDLHGEVLITSNVQSTRHLKASSSSLQMSAADDMRMTANTIDLTSHGDVQFDFKDPEASFVIKSGHRFLLSSLPDYSPALNGGDGYRLCICSNGKVFRGLSNNCAIISEHINPCN